MTSESWTARTSATISAASSALASVARGPAQPVAEENQPAASNGQDGPSRQNGGLTGYSPASADGAEDCVVHAHAKGSSVEIVHWSTLWSQPQLKRKLLVPLNGSDMHCSRDGTTATLEFRHVALPALMGVFSALTWAQALVPCTYL